jgi:hypothetical protein
LPIVADRRGEVVAREDVRASEAPGRDGAVEDFAHAGLRRAARPKPG